MALAALAKLAIYMGHSRYPGACIVCGGGKQNKLKSSHKVRKGRCQRPGGTTGRMIIARVEQAKTAISGCMNIHCGPSRPMKSIFENKMIKGIRKFASYFVEYFC